MNIDLPFLGQIAGQGLLGVLLALSLFVNFYLFKYIQNLNEKRVDEAKEITTKLLEPVNQIKTNGELLIQLFQKFLNGKQ